MNISLSYTVKKKQQKNNAINIIYQLFKNRSTLFA